MKKNLRYGLLAVLVLALLVVTAVAASATNHEVGDGAALATAVSSAASGDTITLTADIGGLDAVTFSSGSAKTLTLDGDGHKLTFTGDGITVGDNMTMTIVDLTLDRASSGGRTNGTALLVNASSADLTLTNLVVIDNFAFGIKMTVPATLTIDGASTSIEAGGKCLWLATGSFGGLVTIEDGTFRPTATTSARWDGAIICSGAEVIINGGTFYSINHTSGVASNGAALVWGNDLTDGYGSAVTVNDGTFTVQGTDKNSPLILVWSSNNVNPSATGTYYHPYVGDGKNLLTINGGTFSSWGNLNSRIMITADNAGGGIYNHPEAYDDIVINGGTFDWYSGWGDQAMFKMAGAMRLTINGGSFRCRSGASPFLFLDNRSDGKTITHTIKGGTIEANLLCKFADATVSATHVHFGAFEAGEEVGPTVTMTPTSAEAHIIAYSGANTNGCTVKFYGGAYTVSAGPAVNAAGSTVAGWNIQKFIRSTGGTFHFYGGTFNFNLAADMTDVTHASFSNASVAPVFGANAGKSGPVVNFNGNGHTLSFDGQGLYYGSAGSGPVYALNMDNVTIDRDEAGGSCSIWAASRATALTLSRVSITDKWNIGVESSNATGTITINDYCNFEAQRKSIQLNTNSLGGLVTINGEHTVLRPTSADAPDATLCIYANGADVVINGGTLYGIKYNKTGTMNSWHGGLIGTYGTATASAITINGGTFICPEGYNSFMFAIWGGKWPTFGAAGDKNWMTINGGTFTANDNGIMFSAYYNLSTTTYADIVINGGTFNIYADSTGSNYEYWPAMFSLNATCRLTVNDGTFNVGGYALFMEVKNMHNSMTTTHNVKGGTINASSFCYFLGSANNRGAVNFGDPELAGPTVNLTLANMINNGNYGASGYDYGKGNIFLQSDASSTGVGVLNFYSGTYNLNNVKPRNKADTADLNYTGTAFIDGEGVPVNFYGGTFNFRRSGPMVYSQDGGYNYSAINFYANAGGTGGVFNFDSAGGYLLRIYVCADRQSVTHVGHLYNDPTHGNKLIINIQAGTFNAGTGGKQILLIQGPAPIINFGAADKPGPTFTFPAGNNSNTYAIHLQSGTGRLDTGLYGTEPQVSGTDITKTPAILNFYSGTYQMLGDNNGFISANGGTINIEGGTFKVANNNKLINFYDNDGVGNLSISGGTFDLAGSGSILNFSALKAPNNTAGTRLTTGDVAITGGTFKSTGSADGVLFSLNGSYPGSFSISGATFSEMTANARYFSIGQTLPFTPSITSQVFPTDPVKGLGGYTTTSVVGGYQPTATKLFAGGQMIVTNNYELAIFWKLTEAQAENYTKTTITFDGKSPYDITEKTVSDKYPDGSDVESGYKVVKVVLDHITVRELGYYFRADLYVSGDLIASTDYSALEYLRKVGHATIAQREAKLEADAGADVKEEESTIGLLSSMIWLAYSADIYAGGSGISKGGVVWYNDRLFSQQASGSDPTVFMPVFSEVAETGAVWTGETNANANLTSVGLRFTNNIQFYVEFEAASLDGISVTYTALGGEPAEARIVNIAGSTYRAYTQFTNLSNLDNIVTFTLAGDTHTQTCEYSITAFVSRHQNSATTAKKNLTRALYQFKEAVAAYYSPRALEKVEIGAGVQFVYDRALDDSNAAKYSAGDRSPYYDYPVSAARTLRATLATVCGADENAIALNKDSASEEETEIAVGLTCRAITGELLERLGAVNRYGFLVKNGKVAVVGYNDVTLALAVELFDDYLGSAAKRDNGDGTYTVLLPDGLCIVRTYTSGGWVTDFPLPDYANLTLNGTADVGSGALEYYYTGAGATAENFTAYCAALTADGYTLYTSNTIEGSQYRTYTKGGVMLYVSYAAFSHAGEQSVDLFDACIRIVSAPVGNSPLSTVKLPEADAFNKATTLGSYVKITDTRITAVQLADCGSAYVITLEDGSFIVVDGGNENLPDDRDRLYYVLCDLYELAHGYAPNSTDHRIKLAAWYVTHFHEDHAGNFMEFAAEYGSVIDAERLIGNAPSESEWYNTYNPTPKFIQGNGGSTFGIEAVCGNFGTPMSYYKVHTGWKFYIRNVEFEVLCTHEDLYPARLGVFNNSTTIVRMTVYSTDGSGNTEGTPTAILWLGDMEDLGSKFLRAAYGDYVQSDMCQVAHHGGQGCEWALYQLVDPTCLLWPHKYGADYNSGVRTYFRNRDTLLTAWTPNSEYTTLRYGYVVNTHLVHDLSSLEYVIVCDVQNVTVTLDRDGAHYNLTGTKALYNADSRLGDHSIGAYAYQAIGNTNDGAVAGGIFQAP